MKYHGLEIPREKLAEFCRRHHIRRLSFFGSILRDDFRPDSDVDVLVEFEPEHTPGWGLIRIEHEFSAMLDGHPVEMVDPKYLNRWIRDQVLEEAETQYVAER